MYRRRNSIGLRLPFPEGIIITTPGGAIRWVLDCVRVSLRKHRYSRYNLASYLTGLGLKFPPAYRPSLPALSSRNKLPSRIYRRTIWTDRCPVCFMIDRSEAPAIAAAVACPALREWPAYLAGSRPARAASFFVTRATSIPLSRRTCTCPCRLIDRNSGPAVTPA